MRISRLRNRTMRQRYNLLAYKLSSPKANLSYRPTRLGVYVTSRCTLRCRFCPYQASDCPYAPEPYDDMSFDTFRKIVDGFDAATVLTLTGEGEPFLNKELFKMIRYASRIRKMTVTSSTNGIIIGNRIEEIVTSDLSELNISIDAVSAEKYKITRGGGRGAYEIILTNTQNLVEAKRRLTSGMKIRMSHILTSQTYKDAPKVIELAEELGVDKLRLHNVTAFGTELSRPEDCLFDDPEVVQFMRELPASKIEVQPPRLYRREGPISVCDDPFTSIGINTRGDINICCMLGTNARYGNIFQGDVWNNEQFQRARRLFLKGKLPFDLCRYCPPVYNPQSSMKLRK